MTHQEWLQIKHFKSAEFDDPTKPGSGLNMKWEIVSKLDQIRERIGQPLVVMSGYRTGEHNAQVGGVDGSAHTAGFAVDIACRTSGLRFAILQAALDVGISRIGLGHTFIHLDVDPEKPQRVAWDYQSS